MAPQQSKTRTQLAKAPSELSPTTSSAEPGNDLGNRIATVALVGVGAALIEAELIPGILIGAAAMLVPNVLPKISSVFRPLVKQTIRLGYAVGGRAREGLAGLNEEMQDVVAEVKSDSHSAASTPAGQSEGARATTPAV
jgi:hypothetical protein